jgi:putative endonuclease
MEKQYHVYIMTNKRNGTLYIGMTSDLIKSVWQHKNELVEGFTKRYSVKRLVYFEVYISVGEAILREKRLKKWNRKWKLRIIEEANPEWNDLYSTIC